VTDLLKRIFNLLSLSDRKKGAFLVILMLITSLLDAVGIVSVMPFMAVVANPKLIEASNLFSFIYSRLNFSEVKDFIFFLGISSLAILLVSLLFRAYVLYAQTKFALLCEHALSSRLFERYLRQQYSSFLNLNSAELGKSILSEVGQVIQGGVLPFMTLLSQSFTAISIILLLLWYDFKLALIVTCSLGSAYVTIYFFTKRFLSRIGQERYIDNQSRFAIISEAFGAIKEVKFSSLEELYLNRFNGPSRRHALNTAYASIVVQTPRFGLEMVVFGGMLGLMLYFLNIGGGLAAALPIISLYALAGYKLMPTLQQIYGSFSNLQFARKSVESICLQLDGFKVNIDGLESGNRSNFLQQFSKISLKHISFSYPGAKSYAIKDLSMDIEVNTTIGLVGSTGCGKTTLIDLILGLLEPSSGVISIDKIGIDNNNMKQLQKIIGYVPQQIYLSDDTISANIAFGVDRGAIDQKVVESAAIAAELHEFVVSELPMGYQTNVGEGGIRLSGGQRQRIGIARALYRTPKILIFDEATSALDNLTEKIVMEAIKKLSHRVTIIMVAHRLETVRQCDAIYLLQDGQIAASGTYGSLLEKSPLFRKMVKS
jgi:ABC-type multidrug transport system fused ATPase/permease subunit